MFDYTEGKLKFKKIIDLNNFKNLNDIEKYEYLIKKHIYIKGEKSTSFIEIINDSEIKRHPNNPTEFYFSTYAGFDYNGYNYKVNKEIIDEFYNLLHLNIEENNAFSDIDWIIEEIDTKSRFFINKDDNLTFLNTTHQKYYKIFTENFYESKLYINEPFQEFKNWKDFISSTFEEALFKYLTVGYNNLLCDSTVQKWIKINEAKRIMDYCKELIGKLHLKKPNTLNQSEQSTTTNNGQLENIIDNKSDTFKFIYSENLFIHLLKSTGAIKQDNTIRTRKFIPVCDAIYTTDLGRPKGTVIFKEVLTKNEFADFLRDKYKVKINNNNKFSTGKRYTTSIQTLINSYLKK